MYDLGDNCIHHDMKEDSVDFLLVSSSGQLVVMATINGDISVIDTDSCKFFFLFEKKCLNLHFLFIFCTYVYISTLLKMLLKIQKSFAIIL